MEGSSLLSTVKEFIVDVWESMVILHVLAPAQLLEVGLWSEWSGLDRLINVVDASLYLQNHHLTTTDVSAGQEMLCKHTHGSVHPPSCGDSFCA